MNIIACTDINWGIGYMDELLFDIPMDKAFFKKKTSGKTVIMGRKTYESLPVKPLPSRRNIVLTRKEISYKGVQVCHSINEIINKTKNEKSSDIFVIGGEETYSLLIDLCDTAYITCVQNSLPADRHIYNFDKSDKWVCTECSDNFTDAGFVFCFKKYVRK